MDYYTCDIEVLPNYILIAFRGSDGSHLMFDTTSWFTRSKRRQILNILENNLIITFNGIKYDIPIIVHALYVDYHTVRDYYKTSRAIINDRKQPWDIYKMIGEKPPKWNHIDLKEPAPDPFASLKLYGTRLGSRRLQEFPIDFNKDASDDDISLLRKYCGNDLIITEELYLAILPSITLREKMSKKYGFDMRSLSDAQIAENILINLAKNPVKRLSLPTGYTVTYIPPRYITFKTKQLQDVFRTLVDHTYNLDGTGKASIPAKIRNMPIKIGDTEYQIGVGGLHSKESKLAVTGGLMNADITSMYPLLIINQQLYPKSFGKVFLEIYEDIKNVRLIAKAEGASDPDQKEVAGILKIVLNGSFGKFGSKYSKLYDPSLLLQTTITGQLTLLMLIEDLERNGITVVSANTDGVECKAPTRAIKRQIRSIVNKHGELSNLDYEFGEYDELYARDVNNYVAVYDGYVKAKGAYGNEQPLKKNKETPIVYHAIREFLLHGTQIEDTIDACTELVDFTASRNVKGGGVGISYMPEMYPEGWDESLARNKRVTKKMLAAQAKLNKVYAQKHGKFLGKVVRWYYSTEGETIYYKSNGNKVPKSDGSRYLMDLRDDIPEDLDYEKYYDLAYGYLDDLGFVFKDS